jgi:hypothetical protein
LIGVLETVHRNAGTFARIGKLLLEERPQAFPLRLRAFELGIVIDGGARRLALAKDEDVRVFAARRAAIAVSTS